VAQRPAFAKELVRRALVDHHHGAALVVVCGLREPAGQQPEVQHLPVGRIHLAQRALVHLLLVVHRHRFGVAHGGQHAHRGQGPELGLGLSWVWISL